jgi:hypothetical protein
MTSERHNSSSETPWYEKLPNFEVITDEDLSIQLNKLVEHLDRKTKSQLMAYHMEEIKSGNASGAAGFHHGKTNSDQGIQSETFGVQRKIREGLEGQDINPLCYILLQAMFYRSHPNGKVWGNGFDCVLRFKLDKILLS